jgi:uncharacterized RDD family membrane protein YckC
VSYPSPPPPPPPGQWQPVPPPLAPNGQPLATFLDRFLAYLLDSLILGAVLMVVFLPVMVLWFAVLVGEIATAQQAGGEPDPLVIFGSYFLMFGILIVLSLVGIYLYYVEYQLRQNGQTIGKKALKLWVIPVAPGEALTRSHLARRWAVQSVVAQFVPMFGLLDGLWQLWDKPLQQCLHDKAAQTVVVKLG